MKVIIAINSGSSTCKFSVFIVGEDSLERVFDAKTDHLKHQLNYRYSDGAQQNVVIDADLNPLAQALFGLNHVLTELKQQTFEVHAIAHRFAHSGSFFTQPVLIDKNSLVELQRAVAFAPLHMPAMVALLENTLDIATHIPQVACFDTSYHRSRNDFEKRYAIDKKFHEMGIRSYGFHGLSYQSIVMQLKAEHLLADNLLVLHLGNGASLCAIHKGESVYTTMGFSPLDGLAMSTRCGHLDPGALLEMMRARQLDPDAIERILYKESGLLGLSGETSDMRDLLNSKSAEAAYAVDYFCYKINQYIGQAFATLGRIDQVVFTGGIGENSAVIRQKICALSGWLGVSLDEEKNQGNETGIISTAHSKVVIMKMVTDENHIIACETLKCLADTQSNH